MKQLPQEILDLIIDYLHENPQSLKACSLTCRAWTSSAQPHIFRRVLLGSTSAEHFARLCTTSPHIARYVRILKIQPRTRFTADNFTDVVLPFIASQLTRVEELELVNIIFDASDRWSAFLPAFMSLVKVSLVSCFFRTFDVFRYLMGSHENIQVLRLENARWLDEIKVSPCKMNSAHDPAPPPLLKSLILTSSPIANHVVDWLVFHRHTIATIILPSLYLEDAPAISRFLQSFGSFVFRLEVGLNPYGQASTETAKMLSVQLATSLRSLSVELVLYNDRLRTTQLEWVSIILAQVTSTHIEEVTFKVRFNIMKDLSVFDFEKIDAILARPIFEGLSRVVFCLSSARNWEEGMLEIKARMPFASHKGRLVFRFKM